MDHIKCYENFSPLDLNQIKIEIESILENLDINLNIDEWKFFPNSYMIKSGVQYNSTVVINLAQNNPVRKILEELKWIILGINSIEGVKLTNTVCNTIAKDTGKYGWSWSLNNPDHPDYLTQLDLINKSENTYWINSIQINILYDLPLNRGTVGKNRR